MARKTVFLNGINVKDAVVAGGSAGDLTLDSSYGLAADDVLAQVYYVELSGAVVAASADVTSEFSITGANTINNTGGTDLSDTVVHVKFFDQNPND